jgi:hypothetical protein
VKFAFALVGSRRRIQEVNLEGVTLFFGSSPKLEKISLSRLLMAGSIFEQMSQLRTHETARLRVPSSSGRTARWSPL